MKTEKAYYTVLMLLSSVLVSTSFVVGEIIAHQIDPAVLTLIRFAIGGLILGVIVSARGEFYCSISLILRTTTTSCCLVVFFWSMFLALRYTTALNTSVLFALTPLFSAVYSMVFLREVFCGKRFLALFCGGLGAIWVIFHGDFSLLFSMNWNRGDLIFLAGCAAMGFYAPLVKLSHRGESMLLFTFWVLATGTILLLFIVMPKLINYDWSAIAPSCWAWVLYLAIFTTVITFYLVQVSIPHLGPIKVTAYSYLYPALVLFLDLLRGHGLPDPLVWPGLIVVASAMFFIMDDNVNSEPALHPSQPEQE